MFRSLGKLKGYPRKNKGKADDGVVMYRIVRCVMAFQHLPLELVTQETTVDIRKSFKNKDKRVTGNVDVFIFDYPIKYSVEEGCIYQPC